MVKNLVDGSKAVALFNRNHEPKEVAISWNELGITGSSNCVTYVARKISEPFLHHSRQ